MKRTCPVSKLVSKIGALFCTGIEPLTTQPEPIRSVVSESGRVYMTLRMKEDMVAMRFTRPGVNDFDILFDRKAMPQMIEIFKEFSEIEAVNQNES